MYQCECGRVCKSNGGLTLHKKKCTGVKEPIEKKIDTSMVKMPASIITNMRKHKSTMLKAAYTRFNTEVFDGKLPADLPVQFSYSMTKKAGVCHSKYSVYPDKTVVPGSVKCKIILSSAICTNQIWVYNTLLHEMCHAAVSIIDENLTDGHGPLWWKWVNKAYETYPEYGAITVTVDRPIQWTH
jgi:hypothetical protein